MATPAECPQCGADVESGAEICTACGHKLTASEMTSEPPPATPPPASTPPPPSAPAPTASGGETSFDFAANLAEFRSRWGIEQTSVFTVALALAVIALAGGTIAVIMWLIASGDDFNQKDDAFNIFSVVLPAALGTAGLLAYLRLESGSLSGEAHSQDRNVGFAIFGFAIAFTLLMLYKGLDESLDAEAGWFYYALLFSFFAIGFNIIAKPIPPVIAGLASSMIGFIAMAVAGILVVIGGIQYRSDSFSTYSMGVSFLDAGYVLMILILAWFLGMRKASA